MAVNLFTQAKHIFPVFDKPKFTFPEQQVYDCIHRQVLYPLGNIQKVAGCSTPVEYESRSSRMAQEIP
jgi:hypothetical protein